ncbi:hypothetical protein MHAS_03051 [Mycolicibacterium hassiacum DSM 44199]|nr:hypothetical protein MHAS_03051 [Mycolicibacterium hassiacum DSM 44199]
MTGDAVGVDPGAVGLLDGARTAPVSPVRNLDASICWCSAVFGCEPLSAGSDTGSVAVRTRCAVYHLAGPWILLSEKTADATLPGRDAARPVFLTPRRIAEICREPTRRGVRFPGDETLEGLPADTDGVRSGRDTEFVWLGAPDGNRFEFCRVLEPS